MEKLGLKKKARLQLRTVHMRMGLSLLSLGELSKSEQCFLSLAWPQTTDDKSKILALRASSALAQICLCKGSLDEAEDWCNKSRIGWKRIAGKEHPAYITCLRLSAFSSELNGNHAEAAAFEEIANESIAAPAVVDTGLDTDELLGFTTEKSRNLVTEYHKKVPVTTGNKASTKSRPCSPAKRGSDLTNLSSMQNLVEAVSTSESEPIAMERLHDAVLKGNTALVERLLENGADIEKEFGIKPQRPLHLAAWNGQRSSVDCLLDRGANIEAKDRHGWTAFFLAAWKGHTSIVECLLDRGANIEVKNADGRTALSEAAKNGYISIVQRLLDRGADIEAKSNKGNTALLKATWKGHTPIIECLLDRGANIEAKNADGRTALLEAAVRDHISIVQCLLDRGAKIEAKDNIGSTALTVAASNGHTSIVKSLLDRGADIEARDHSGRTALLSACRFIEGAKYNSNTKGYKSGIIQTIELLCSRRAGISVKDDLGKSSLRYAKQVDDLEIRRALVRVLKKYGAEE